MKKLSESYAIIIGAFITGVFTVLATFPVASWLQPAQALAETAFTENAKLFYDFEKQSELENWREELDVQMGDEHFTGEHALEASIPLSPTQENTYGIKFAQQFTADLIVGRIFFPKDDLVTIEYAQVCLMLASQPWACEDLPKERGKWNTFAIKLAAVQDSKHPGPLNQIRVDGMDFIILAKGVTAERKNPMKVYLDRLKFTDAA